MSKSSEPVELPVYCGVPDGHNEWMYTHKHPMCETKDCPEAKEALPNNNGSGNDKLPQPSLPVESLEDLIQEHSKVLREQASGKKQDLHELTEASLFYAVHEWAEREKQKARIELLQDVWDTGYKTWRENPDAKSQTQCVSEELYRRLKELRG